jgi:hypothetical protein
MGVNTDGLSGIIGVPGWAKAQQEAAVDEWFEQSMSQTHVAKKRKLLRLRHLKKFERVYETLQPTIQSSKHGGEPSKASQAGSPAGSKSRQSSLGLEIDHGPVDLKVSRKPTSRNEFGDIKGLF